MNPKQLFTDYINRSSTMQLATIANDTPWICTVSYAIDSDNVCYWLSNRQTQHSQHLRQNKSVAVAIVVDHSDKQGIQMQGKAYELSGDEAVTADNIYSQRYGKNDKRLAEALSDDPTLRAYYKFIPETIVIFDLKNFPTVPRQVIA